MSVKGEILMELLADHDIWISREIGEKVANKFSDHLSEEQFNYPIESKSTTEKTWVLENKIKQLEKEIEVYKENVRNRKGAAQVYIENNEVKYDLR